MRQEKGCQGCKLNGTKECWVDKTNEMAWCCPEYKEEHDFRNFSALTRFKNKQWGVDEDNRKATIRICGFKPFHPLSVKGKCCECGREVYYVDDNPDLLKPEHKKICPYCVLKNHIYDMNDEQIEIMKKTIENFENVLRGN